jgi:hypothetical protein
MKRFLILAAFVCLAFWGCNGDNGVTSQNQISSLTTPQNETIAPPPASDQNQNASDQSLLSEDARSPICYANNFVGQTFHVVKYQNRVITADIAPVNCSLTHPNLKGEVRRPHTRGIREFVGDARRIQGDRITLFTGSLPKSCRPKKGETLKMIWKLRRKH